MRLSRHQVHIEFTSPNRATFTTALKQTAIDVSRIKEDQVLDLITLKVENMKDYDEIPNFLLTNHNGFCAVSYRQYPYQSRQIMAMIRVGRFKDMERDTIEVTNEGTFRIVLEYV